MFKKIVKRDFLLYFKEFLEKEFKCVFSVIKAEDSDSLKALSAIPSKVAIEIK